MSLLAAFVAMFLDPVRAILALAGGAISRNWWHVLYAALVAAGVVELLLTATQVTRTFNPTTFLIGLAAAGVWALIGFQVRKVWQRWRSNPAD